MIERVAADFIVILHLGFILFVGLGAFLSLRWKRAPLLHLPAALWGAAIEFRHGICPLTPLEQRLRAAAGEAGYSGSFIEHYLMPIIYPARLDESTQYLIGTLVVVINLAVYAWVFYRRSCHRSEKAGRGGSSNC
ncbi:DUF2784 domain-containing protein [Sulfuritalea hydrogenivorans]|jgi:hypothetical protein|uniref:DUF2784 domain-containing protein n=1 Tax=Sulfuritalea hydrogenivorans sk43H TaxID=1223802 RepID=W0SH76_9PROT|nr:DUF2784 domain-containing protein [Sulfuritalea hydrogenivorans]MDK9712811.1 DUF2784 domain-containing protein [Sulfuritalea sp.]BAO30120.1 hypothetical protein SUTH_02331 [Sulfuritalea hydrogenivorans sk43H]